MAFSTRLASDNQPTFDFYSGFLTVVYGLLVSNGLEEVVKFGGDNPADQLETVYGLQFIATFILALHFWFAFATLGETSDEFFEAISPNAAICNVFVVIDILVATWLGFLLLEMFATVSKENFYLWLLRTSVTSLGYDSYSLMLRWGATWGRRQPIESNIRTSYIKKINRWLRRDVFFVIASGAMYLIGQNYSASKSLTYGTASFCIVVAVLVLLMDLASVRPLHALRRLRSL